MPPSEKKDVDKDKNDKGKDGTGLPPLSTSLASIGSVLPGTPKDPSTPTAFDAVDTVIILDWDDTLLASSFLSGKGYRLDTPLERAGPSNDHGARLTSEQLTLDQQLRALDIVICSFLSSALQIAPNNVHVVTNAETGWVQLSAQKFLPNVVPFLSRVKVVSARSTYEKEHPEAPLKWKFFAVQEKIAKFLPENKDRNFLSLGDSHVEREAVRAATKGMPRTWTKSVKFPERPSLDQLRRQVELMSSCLSSVVAHEGDLDLQLTLTWGDPTAAASQSVVPVPNSFASIPILSSCFTPLTPTTTTFVGSIPVTPLPAMTVCGAVSPAAPVSPTTPTPTPTPFSFCAPVATTAIVKEPEFVS